MRFWHTQGGVQVWMLLIVELWFVILTCGDVQFEHFALWILVGSACMLLWVYNVSDEILSWGPPLLRGHFPMLLRIMCGALGSWGDRGRLWKRMSLTRGWWVAPESSRWSKPGCGPRGFVQTNARIQGRSWSTIRGCCSGIYPGEIVWGCLRPTAAMWMEAPHVNGLCWKCLPTLVSF